MEFFHDLGIEDVLLDQEFNFVKQAHSVRAPIRHKNIVFAPIRHTWDLWRPYGGPMAALYDFGKKFSPKTDQNSAIFFFQKRHFKTRSETRFHQNRQFRADFRLKNVKTGET